MTDLKATRFTIQAWHFGFNWPAFIISVLLTVVLVRGIGESASTNTGWCRRRVLAIFVLSGFAASYVHPANWHPFVPNGWPGILTGGSIIFFTYIGFDSVSTAAESAARRSVICPLELLRPCDLHDSLHRRGRRPHRLGAVAIAAGRCSARRQCAEAAGIQRCAAGRAHRRPDWHDFVAAGFSAGPGACLV